MQFKGWTSTYEYCCPDPACEDNPMDVDLTRRAFSRHNLVNRLEVARDGQEALELIEDGIVGVDAFNGIARP